MSTLNIQLLCRRSTDFPELAIFASRPGTLIGSNNPWLEQFSMVPEVFKHLKFGCSLFTKAVCVWSGC